MRRETFNTTDRAPRETTGKTTTPEAARGNETIPVTTEQRDIFTLMRDMERMLEENFRRPLMGFDWPLFRHLLPEVGRGGEMVPAVDMYEEGNELVVKAELPGIKKENITVNLEDNKLTITGEKTTEEKVERKDYLRLERSHGTFSRTLVLPEGLKSEKVHAAFTDGILEIRIPRLVERQAKRTIAIE